MTTLYIAEKPSLAGKLAEALGGGKKTPTHYYGSGWAVAWCVGHFFELYEPSDYDEALKKRSLDTLPIFPEKWQLKAKRGFSKNIKAAKQLANTATKVVNVGDPDREGQLLVDQLIFKIGYRGPVLRLWPKKTTVKGLSELVSNLKDNSEYKGYRLNAQTRQRADWLVGMNLSRYFDLKHRGLLSKDRFITVGRVQTPTLGIVVKRQEEIDNFKPTEHYVIQAMLEHDLVEFEAKWVPPENLLNENKHCLDKKPLIEIIKQLNKAELAVDTVEDSPISTQAPLPYTLSKLQSEASKRHGIKIKTTAKCCQSLYEIHGLTTYPRTDCPYLEELSFNEAEDVLNNIQEAFPVLSKAASDSIDPSKMPASFNDSKVGAHAGIIPTDKKPDLSELNKNELIIYGLICKRYLQQFMPTFDYIETKITLKSLEQTFFAKGNVIKCLGWKSLEDKQEENKIFPELQEGDNVEEVQYKIKDITTQPPKYFTESTLLTAMTNISRYVTNPEIKKILSETDGLGTEATKTGIINLLVERGFIEEFKKGKTTHLKATNDGKLLMGIMPDELKDPSFTALWEKRLNVVEQKADEETAEAFLGATKKWISTIINQDKDT
jgi:DNA topoisomerase-3